MSNRKARTGDETELKIRMNRADLEAVFAALRPKDIADVRTKYTPRQYYDTPDLDLHKQGMSLRIQYAPGKQGKAGGYEQMFKYDLSAAANAAFTRREVKNPIEHHTPDVTVVTDPQVQRVIGGFDTQRLRHIFTAQVERRYFDVTLDKKDTVELAFDLGIIYLAAKPDVSLDICEIEVEIKKGSPDAIEKIKSRILAIAPSAKIEIRSKADQGVELYERAYPKL